MTTYNSKPSIIRQLQYPSKETIPKKGPRKDYAIKTSIVTLLIIASIFALAISDIVIAQTNNFSTSGSNTKITDSTTTKEKKADTLVKPGSPQHNFDYKKQIFPAVGIMFFFFIILFTVQNFNPD